MKAFLCSMRLIYTCITYMTKTKFSPHHHSQHNMLCANHPYTQYCYIHNSSICTKSLGIGAQRVEIKRQKSQDTQLALSIANLFVFKQSNLFAFPNVKSLYLSTVLCEHQLSVCLFDLFCIVTCPGLIPHAVCASFIMGQGCGPRRQTGAALCGCVHFLTKNVSTKSQICLLFASYHEQSSLSCRQEPSSMKQTFNQ